MIDRSVINGLLEQLYGARVRGDLDAVCATFSSDAVLRISGASDNNPIAVTATGAKEIRRLLSMMIKSFKLSEYASLAVLIDGNRASVHWRVRINSRITGTSVLTELMNIIEIRDARIVGYTEFFVPA
jgi:ketosteroid isomerase-like protein